VGSPEASFIGARTSAMSSNDERFVVPLYSASTRWITFKILGGKGKKHRFLLPDARGKGYDAQQQGGNR
jgi:hypothetical protein